MNEILVYAIVSLGGIGLVSAVVLFLVSKKFHVPENKEVEIILEHLPGANCGGCGFPGCRAFAEALSIEKSLKKLNCPASPKEELEEIARLIGASVCVDAPKIAVVRCGGTKELAPSKVAYEGVASCSFANQLFAGESGCPHSCLGLGDCYRSCKFGAIFMNPTTGLPEICEDNCVACAACVLNCPRHIMEIRYKGKKGKRIYVSCVNKEKGAVCSKNCKVSCIGCGKCQKACAYEAITIENNLAYIDFEKCKLCRKCVSECPTGAIVAKNFPIPNTKKDD